MVLQTLVVRWAPVALLLVTAGVMQNSARAQEEEDASAPHARALLISEATALLPGRTHYLGIAFEIDPGWHLYWNGRNDSGLPISVVIELPDGWTAGELLWPAPERHVSPGEILDHVYLDRALLLLPIHVPMETPPGMELTIRGHVDWLVCREACIPGESDLRLNLSIARLEDAIPSSKLSPSEEAGSSVRFSPAAEADWFRRARARLPRPTLPPNSDIRWAWNGDTLVIEANRAAGLVFYPHQDCVDLVDPIRNAETSSTKLVLPFREAENRESGDLQEPASRISGVLEVRRQPGHGSTLITLDLPIPRPSMRALGGPEEG